jgi:hypothetical protein
MFSFQFDDNNKVLNVKMRNLPGDKSLSVTTMNIYVEVCELSGRTQHRQTFQRETGRVHYTFMLRSVNFRAEHSTDKPSREKQAEYITHLC